MILLKLINDRFAGAVEYRDYHLMQKASQYDKDVSKELQKTALIITVQMKSRTFSEEDKMSEIAIFTRIQVGL